MSRTPKQARCTNCRQLLKPGAPNSIGSGDIWAHQECPPTMFRTRFLSGTPIIDRRPLEESVAELQGV